MEFVALKKRRYTAAIGHKSIDSIDTGCWSDWELKSMAL